MNRPPPVALTIAGSDNSAGAGLQADLKTFSAHGVYGLTAVTCVVAEVPGLVSGIQAVEARWVAEQIRLSAAAFPVAAVKTGMLQARATIEVAHATLREMFRARPAPLVVDPVMVASSGAPLLDPDGIDGYRELLFPLATLVTPNLDEVRTLLGRAITSEAEMRRAGEELCARFGAAFLIKGGHLAQASAVDFLCTAEGVEEFRAPWVPGVSTHGTGCTFSAAITARLARGEALREAVAGAKEFVTRAMGEHFLWGNTAALNHFAQAPSR